MKDISGRTKVVGIFGDPVGHSLSPVMHNRAFETLGLDMVYLPFHVTGEYLKDAVDAIRALDMKGVNITIPHKERVMEYLDELSDDARDTGAVNTVVNRDGRLMGFNTDGRGYILSLEEETSIGIEGRNILIIGAGGASRAIAFALLSRKPACVVIANRTLKRGENLADDLREKFPGVDIIPVSLSKEGILPYTDRFDLVVNTTSMGMSGKGDFDLSLLPMERLKPEVVVSDIVYNPLDTGLIKEAERRGLRVHRGLGMLVYQGALSFELWTGRKAPIDIMKRTLLEALRG